MIVKFENFVSKADGLRENMLFLFHGPNQGKVEDCTSYIINLKKEKNDFIEVLITSSAINGTCYSKDFCIEMVKLGFITKKMARYCGRLML